jgi:hypothetical protein
LDVAEAETPFDYTLAELEEAEIEPKRFSRQKRF